MQVNPILLPLQPVLTQQVGGWSARWRSTSPKSVSRHGKLTSGAVLFTCGFQPAGKRTVLPRSDTAGLWRRPFDPDHAGDVAWDRGRAAVASPRYPAFFFHMNEGHVAFISLELIREKIAQAALSTRHLPELAENAYLRPTLRWKRGTTGSALTW